MHPGDYRALQPARQALAPGGYGMLARAVMMVEADDGMNAMRHGMATSVRNGVGWVALGDVGVRHSMVACGHSRQGPQQSTQLRPRPWSGDGGDEAVGEDNGGAIARARDTGRKRSTDAMQRSRSNCIVQGGTRTLMRNRTMNGDERHGHSGGALGRGWLQ